MKVYEALARAFVAEGVDTVFSLMGDANLYWLATLAGSPGVRNVHVRNEAGGVAMADGYARSTGRVGVAAVTCGPGLTNAATSLVAAVRYRCPVVLFAGATPTHDADSVQYLDQRAFVETCGAVFQPVTGVGTCLDAVRRAFHTARAREVPVVLNVPMDLQQAELDGPFEYVPSEASLPGPSIVPSPELLDKAAGIIASSRRPVIVVGRGTGKSDGAFPLVERLGETIGALYATTLLGKGALGTSPYMLGIAGEFADDTTSEHIRRADCVIALGASLNAFTTQDGRLFEHAAVVQVASDEQHVVAPHGRVDCYLQGDVAQTVAALLETFERAGYASPGFRAEVDGGALRAAAARRGGAPGPAGSPGTMDPRDACDVLERRLPDDAIVVQGAGHFWSFPITQLTGSTARQFIFTNGFGAVGQGLPIAIGAAIGRPDRSVVLIEGDTSIMMNLQEIDTAARHGARVLMLVMDDDAMGAELHKLQARSVDGESACVPTPDLAAVARSLGVGGDLVTTPGDLDGFLDRYDWSAPHLVDLKISRDVVHQGGILIRAYTG